MKQLLLFVCTLLNGVMHLNHQSQQSPIGARFGLKVLLSLLKVIHSTHLGILIPWPLVMILLVMNLWSL